MYSAWSDERKLAPMKNTGAFSDTFKQKIKKLVFKNATKEGAWWPLDQLQLAEDYIDKLSRGRKPGQVYIQKPIGLQALYARKIRHMIYGQKRSGKRASS